jgi:3-oxoacyl-(acyl-carrier-protein) synthase
VGALVDDSFDPAAFMDKRESRRQGRYTHFAMAASKIAIEDAKVDVGKLESDKFGVLIGSGIGGVEFFEDNCNKFTAAGGGGPGLKKVCDTPAEQTCSRMPHRLLVQAPMARIVFCYLESCARATPQVH